MFVINIVLFIWNLMTFLLMGIDKSRAKRGHWRISEMRLLGVAFLGGALGILIGMSVFHHKTKHFKFKIGVPLLLLINGIIYYGIWKALY